MSRGTLGLLRLALRDLRAGGQGLWVLFACLALGVALIAASAGVHRQVKVALLSDTRALFGGDLEVRSRSPLTPEVLGHIGERARVSLLTEMRTMMQVGEDRIQLVELQVPDAAYPLYGSVQLTPPAPLREALEQRAGVWGAAFDPALARRLSLSVGDRVRVGRLELELRAVLTRQPDRSLRADWRGPPLMVAAGALEASGLVGPGSRVAYRYRARIDGSPTAWGQALQQRFPSEEFEIRTFSQRSARMAEVLDQVGSALVLVALSALFIGGLGVYNSVHGHLQSRLTTIAVLRALGLRPARLAAVYLFQVLAMALPAGLLGSVIGSGLALGAGHLAGDRFGLSLAPADLLVPAGLAVLFGLLTAVTFSLPALGRALQVPAASLFRGPGSQVDTLPPRWWIATGVFAALTAALAVVATPDPVFAIAFVVVVIVLLVLLEGLTRALKRLSGRALHAGWLRGRLPLRLALANLHRPGSPLRASLLSLGAALTVLVACALVVGAAFRTLDETLPREVPSLLFYDIPATQLGDFEGAMAPFLDRGELRTAPLVLGRLEAVNGGALADSADAGTALESRDEHKLSDRRGNIDEVVVDRGAWWPEDYRGPPLVAMEDREADQIGLRVGDRLRFVILGETVEAKLVAIYSQRRLQARFWLEAIFSDGVLDPFVTRHVGAARLPGDAATGAQAAVARAMPGVVTVHTESVLREARRLLDRAGAGLAVVAGVTLIASLLVLMSVMAGARVRQVYDATVLHTLGARVASIRRGLWLEHALLAVLTSLFALALGGAIATAFLELRLDLDGGGAWIAGIAVAVGVSVASLGLGARWLLSRLTLTPARLLRAD